jgi:hypothetical protein
LIPLLREEQLGDVAAEWFIAPWFVQHVGPAALHERDVVDERVAS